MNEALLVMLALLWGILLLPGALRSRRANTMATVGGFERAMDVLRRQPDGRYVMVPGDAGRIVERHGDRTGRTEPTGREDPLVVRRRTRFSQMVLATVALLVVALVAGGFAWTLFAVSVLTTGGYALLLRHLKLRRDQVRDVVRELRGEPAPTPDPPVRESLPMAVGAGPGASHGQVASRPDEPWQPMAGVRIRRWDD